MDMLLRLITGAPVYVWPLLIGLIWLGLKSRKDRETSILPLYALPFLALAGLPNLLAMPNQSLTWGVWAITYAAGALGGYALQSRYVIARVGSRAQLRGEWVTMIMVMAIFWSSYALGVTAAVAPGALADGAPAVLFPAIEGVLSGMFLGRLLRILRA